MCLISGMGARIREASMAVDPKALLWIHGPYAEIPSTLAAIRVAAIAREPRALRERLREFSAAPGMEQRRFILDVMSIAEWVTRLQKREMRLVAIRRAQRLWLMGDGEALRRSERSEMTSRETLQHAIKNWREELSDEWDEDFDPAR